MDRADRLARFGPQQGVVPAAPKNHPLMRAPQQFREMLGFFWSLSTSVMRRPGQLAARAKLYEKRYGLTEDELRTVLTRLSQPSRAAGHETSPQLMADFARAVDEVLKDRAAAAETAYQRKVTEDVRANPLTPEQSEQWKQWLKGFRGYGAMPRE